MFELITTTHENGWTCLQDVSPFPVFKQIRTTHENGWTCLQLVSPSPVFEQIRTTHENGWTCLQRVSPSPVFTQIRTTHENGWTCLQWVSCSEVFQQIWTTYKNGYYSAQNVIHFCFLNLSATPSTDFPWGPCFSSLSAIQSEIQCFWPVFNNLLFQFEAEVISYCLYWFAENLFFLVWLFIYFIWIIKKACTNIW